MRLAQVTSAVQAPVQYDLPDQLQPDGGIFTPEGDERVRLMLEKIDAKSADDSVQSGITRGQGEIRSMVEAD